MDDNYRNIDQSLISAYLRTTYHVDQLDIQIHIGSANADLQKLLGKFNKNSWAFITAWNPKSILLPQKENDARHEKLVEMIEKSGLPYFTGYGVGADDAWPAEKSLLILGLDREPAVKIGHYFKQNAIVVGTLDTLPELVFC